MATEASQPLKISLVAAADLSGGQFYFVTLDTNGKAALITATTDRPVGVLQNKPTAAGQSAEIVVLGVTKIKTAGALTQGTHLLGPDNAGKAVARTVTASTNWVGGVPLETASSGDVISALVNCVVPLPGT